MTGRRDFPTRAAAMEASDDISSNPSEGDTIGDVIARRYNRRDIMKGALGVTAATALFGPAVFAASKAKADEPTSPFDFAEIEAGVDKTHHVAPGYHADVLLRWGDPLHARKEEAPFDPAAQTVAEQEARFGYNNDYIAYFPIDGSTHGLLCVNHEYTNEELMFPSVTRRQDTTGFEQTTKDIVDLEMAAHGVSVVEIKKEGGAWRIVPDSPYNRRITPNTVMTIDGPVEDTPDRLLFNDDQGSLKTVTGTLNNCAGGQTPWGTYLTAEENFHSYFWSNKCNPGGKRLKGFGGPQKESYKRYKIPSLWQAWGKYYDRFNVDKEENGPNRFGWIVEIDPFDKDSVPVKHTALGRFAHEGAECLVNETDGRVVVYSGDDSRGEFVYRFVSKHPYQPGDKAANMELLSEGTLSVAKFHDNGTVEWLPLDYDTQPALQDCPSLNGQADVMIDARIAATELGATRMDRPEDVQPNKETRRVYVMLTNDAGRTKADKANPRAGNPFGHIIEMTPEGGDHTLDTYDWEILVKCGDPGIGEVGALWSPHVTEDGWFACPDNATVDDQGRLWIATDQGKGWPRTGRADGLYALETEGPRRGTPRMFFRVPVGAELCGPCFTPDGETLFLAVQHPGADGTQAVIGFGRPSTFKDPVTRWPDFADGMPPRPSVMAITKQGGGKIG